MIITNGGRNISSFLPNKGNIDNGTLLRMTSQTCNKIRRWEENRKTNDNYEANWTSHETIISVFQNIKI